MHGRPADERQRARPRLTVRNERKFSTIPSDALTTIARVGVERDRSDWREDNIATLVPARARARNGARAVKTLSAGEQATRRALASEPLGLDSDAAAVVDQLAREGPPPQVLLEIALSSLTIRGMAAPVPQDHTDG